MAARSEAGRQFVLLLHRNCRRRRKGCGSRAPPIPHWDWCKRF